MRISDWSSDVCSSDLHALLGRGPSCRLQPFRTSLAHLLLPSAPGLCGGQQRSQCLVALKQEGDAFGVGKERAQVHLCAPAQASVLSNTSSTLRSKASAIRKASGRDGSNRPSSLALMAFREAAPPAASSGWVQPFTAPPPGSTD